MISNFRVLRVNVKLFDILHRQAMYLFYKNRFKIPMCASGANLLRICSNCLLPQSKISELKSRPKNGPETASNLVFLNTMC